MVLQIDFNNPNILRGYLEQALPQVDLAEARPRIVIGSEGGLAYVLFKDAMHELPSDFRATSLSDMSAAREYFDAVQRYVTSAQKHAGRFGFRLLSVDHKEKLSPELTLDSYLYQAGIGDVPIESAERFERFLKMVKEGRGNLDKQYEPVVSAGKSFKSR